VIDDKASGACIWFTSTMPIARVLQPVRQSNGLLLQKFAVDPGFSAQFFSELMQQDGKVMIDQARVQA